MIRALRPWRRACLQVEELETRLAPAAAVRELVSLVQIGQSVQPDQQGASNPYSSIGAAFGLVELAAPTEPWSIGTTAGFWNDPQQAGAGAVMTVSFHLAPTGTSLGQDSPNSFLRTFERVFDSSAWQSLVAKALSSWCEHGDSPCFFGEVVDGAAGSSDVGPTSSGSGSSAVLSADALDGFAILPLGGRASATLATFSNPCERLEPRPFGDRPLCRGTWHLAGRRLSCVREDRELLPRLSPICFVLPRLPRQESDLGPKGGSEPVVPEERPAQSPPPEGVCGQGGNGISTTPPPEQPEKPRNDDAEDMAPLAPADAVVPADEASTLESLHMMALTLLGGFCIQPESPGLADGRARLARGRRGRRSEG